MKSRFHLFGKRHTASVSRPSDSTAGFPSQHKYLRHLQEGTEGVVQAWMHKSTGVVIVVKLVAPTTKVPDEVQLLQVLPHHTAIVRYLGYIEKVPQLEKSAILLEYCEESDLFTVRDRMNKRDNGIFSEPFLWSVYTQLTSALAFLHEGIDTTYLMGRDNWKAIVHRDVKLENILVKTLGPKNDWSSIVLKLGDFGLAGFHDPANHNPLGVIGTTHTWPPEVSWENKKLSPASDVWGHRRSCPRAGARVWDTRISCHRRKGVVRKEQHSTIPPFLGQGTGIELVDGKSAEAGCSNKP